MATRKIKFNWCKTNYAVSHHILSNWQTHYNVFYNELCLSVLVSHGLWYTHIYLFLTNLYIILTRLGAASKSNRWLTGGSVLCRQVSIALHNDNRPKLDWTAGQPAVGFWSRPFLVCLTNRNVHKNYYANNDEKMAISCPLMLCFFQTTQHALLPCFSCFHCKAETK